MIDDYSRYSEEFIRGYNDYLAGLKREDNPYLLFQQYTIEQWFRGWDAAEWDNYTNYEEK